MKPTVSLTEMRQWWFLQRYHYRGYVWTLTEMHKVCWVRNQCWGPF